MPKARLNLLVKPETKQKLKVLSAMSDKYTSMSAIVDKLVDAVEVKP